MKRENEGREGKRREEDNVPGRKRKREQEGSATGKVPLFCLSLYN